MGNKQCNIGICGATRSGKTTLAKDIVKYLKSDEKHIIHLDDFFSLELLYKHNNIIKFIIIPIYYSKPIII